MAGLIKDLINRISGYDEYEPYEDEYEGEEETFYEEEPQEQQPSSVMRPNFFRQKNARVLDMKNGQGSQVVLLQPSDIETAKAVCNHVRAGRTVICNFEKVEPKVAQRVVDFITGAAYAVDGQISPVSSVIFVIVPRSVALLQGAGDDEPTMDYLKHLHEMAR